MRPDHHRESLLRLENQGARLVFHTERVSRRAADQQTASAITQIGLEGRVKQIADRNRHSHRFGRTLRGAEFKAELRVERPSDRQVESVIGTWTPLPHEDPPIVGPHRARLVRFDSQGARFGDRPSIRRDGRTPPLREVASPGSADSYGLIRGLGCEPSAYEPSDRAAQKEPSHRLDPRGPPHEPIKRTSLPDHD